MTELTLTLNNLLWKHYTSGNIEVARMYDGFWRKSHAWCCENFKGDDLRFYLAVVD